ncbi:MAG: glycosyltransferase family 4 protein [Actinomycetota bacterium]
MPDETHPRVADVIPRLQLRGAEVFAQQLESVLRNRYEMRLFPMYEGGTPAPIDGARLSVAPGVGAGPFARPRAIRSLRRRAREFRPDLLVAHGGDPLRLAVLAGLRDPAPLVYVRVSAVSPQLRTGWRGSSLRAAYSRADALVAVSESLKNELIEAFGVPAEKVRVIRNGRLRREPIDPADRVNVRESLSVAGDEVMLAWVGRMVPEKNPEEAVRLARALNGEGLRARLVMVGDGPLEDRVRSLAQKLPQVRFTGQRPDVHRLIAAADVFVSTSRTEGAPGAIIESLLAGTPVVAPRVGGIPEVVASGENGVLFDPDDPSGLDGAVIGLIRDRARRAELAEGALRSSERFDIRTVAGEYDRLYRELLGR